MQSDYLKTSRTIFIYLQNPEIMKTEKQRLYAKRTIEANKERDVLHFEEIGSARINESNNRYQERISHNDKEIFWSEGTIASQNRHDSLIKPSIHSYNGRPSTKRNAHSHAPYNEMYNMAVMPDFK
jgi:hypothetical protein